MPEYRAPGVYVEEVSFRSKSIEGMPTSTTGFAGMFRYGPVQYPDGPKNTAPRLTASFTELERVYGGLDMLHVGSIGTEERLPYAAHAARAFFNNGGQRLYISRVFAPRSGADAERPSQGAPPRRIMLPPSGFVTGIYARSDLERGVHKAPANEVVRGLSRFEANINKARQDVPNLEGINALRFFVGRGSRVWGARTMSSDPEWKYVNVRRLLIYIEHSLDKGSQWAVFEPNNSRLWTNIRQTVENFLLALWRDGALVGEKPEEAYFVRCDRTTMTQNDLDNGRLICLVGVAPVKPAEFIIFRIGQWTADAKK